MSGAGLRLVARALAFSAFVFLVVAMVGSPAGTGRTLPREARCRDLIKVKSIGARGAAGRAALCLGFVGRVDQAFSEKSARRRASD
jgi:hypothetical protein